MNEEHEGAIHHVHPGIISIPVRDVGGEAPKVCPMGEPSRQMSVSNVYLQSGGLMSRAYSPLGVEKDLALLFARTHYDGTREEFVYHPGALALVGEGAALVATVSGIIYKIYMQRNNSGDQDTRENQDNGSRMHRWPETR
ncbi:hypothetical protein A6A08_16530 [Nocardiopsis sp. TSRI0078]|uniref:hypothetical protein n=1 Tax=unclassified Nocardiopsis TaxID=2649073 RepID=UPI00096410D8|nr:hypothetical protein [Nocardiopsis sp. TSRI0078]OKI13043.1 hypothetical protein A6A08_16530 [Nocardiopsis sp. TSRI0078]